jgi:hypothetical protein
MEINYAAIDKLEELDDVSRTLTLTLTLILTPRA